MFKSPRSGPSPIQEAEATYSKATKAELSRDYDTAFRLYVKSAELFLHLSRSAPLHSISAVAAEKEKLTWKSSAQKALERAEKIKSFVNKSNKASPSVASTLTLTPVSVDQFSESEQFYVLKKGGSVNGLQFALWDEPLSNSHSGVMFEDPDGQPRLSPEQLRVAPIWRRPRCNHQSQDVFSSQSCQTPSVNSIIIQQTVTDCSVCASISVCIEHTRRFGSHLAQSALHPSSSTSIQTTPSMVASPYVRTTPGRYDVKLLFNGDWRRIGDQFPPYTMQWILIASNSVIDDLLPCHPTSGRLMCMSASMSTDPSSTSRRGWDSTSTLVPGESETTARSEMWQSNTTLDLHSSPADPPPTMSSTQILWPTLLEKAYMKLMGGYDFPGSNSSIDLHALTGWIPEHIEMKSSSFERERTWNRVFRGFSSGHCVVTLGTGYQNDIRWGDVEFLASHSYAVIEIKDSEDGSGNERMMTILDSWMPQPTSSDNLEDPSEASRVLEIPWLDVLNLFNGIYVSWDPNMWKNVLTFHGMWKAKDKSKVGNDTSSSKHLRLEFHRGSDFKDDTEVWILLSRHIVETRRASEFIALKVEMLDAGLGNEDQKVVDSKGTYTNSAHILVRTPIPRSDTSGVLSISASYDGELNNTDVGFTLTAYAPSKMTVAWDNSPLALPFSCEVDGTFTSKNAGGNSTYPTFMVNPQYHLRIHPPQKSTSGVQATRIKAHAVLTMQSRKNTPINIMAVWSQGERITELAQKEVAANSGAYNYGVARVSKELAVGDYTIILSAFEPHHMGDFSLHVESSHRMELISIPQEGAGMYQQIIRGSWDMQTAAGGPSLKNYLQNPIFEIHVPAPTQLKIRLQLTPPFTPTLLNVTLYPSSGNGSLGNYVATSGGYSDMLSGVSTPHINVGAGNYWIIPSTYNSGVEAAFRIFVYSTVGGVDITDRRD